jgi:ankyrin repeat protein
MRRRMAELRHCRALNAGGRHFVNCSTPFRAASTAVPLYTPSPGGTPMDSCFGVPAAISSENFVQPAANQMNQTVPQLFGFPVSTASANEWLTDMQPPYQHLVRFPCRNRDSISTPVTGHLSASTTFDQVESDGTTTPRQSVLFSVFEISRSSNGLVDSLSTKDAMKSWSDRNTSSLRDDCSSIIKRFSPEGLMTSSFTSSANTVRLSNASYLSYVSMSSQSSPNDLARLSVTRSLLGDISGGFEQNVLPASSRSSVASVCTVRGPGSVVATRDGAVKSANQQQTLRPPPLPHQQGFLANHFILNSCCRVTEMCLHRKIAEFADSYPQNIIYVFRPLNIDVNETDAFKNSALHIAANWGMGLEVFEYLIVHGANVNAVNIAGQTFMHLLDPINLSHDLRFFRTFLNELEKSGFRFDARDHYGRTILLSLIQEKQIWRFPDLLDILFQSIVNEENAGVQCHARDYLGLTVATKLDEHPVALSSFVPSPLVGRYCTPLFGMTLNDLPPSVLLKFLFGNGTDPWGELEGLIQQHGITRQWWTKSYLPASFSPPNLYPYAMPCIKQRLGVLLFLGFDPNGYDSNGNSPIISFLIASRARKDDRDISELISLLIARGASVHQRNRRGYTALHKAAKLGRKHSTRVLLQNGADANAISSEGRTILATGFRNLKRAKRKGEFYAGILASLSMVESHGGKAV